VTVPAARGLGANVAKTFTASITCKKLRTGGVTHEDNERTNCPSFIERKWQLKQHVNVEFIYWERN
jgi:predicted  nucleic acid-binding Zn ribbon protein